MFAEGAQHQSTGSAVPVYFLPVSSVIITCNFKTHKIRMRGSSGWWLMMHLAKEHHEVVAAASLPVQRWPSRSPAAAGQELHRGRGRAGPGWGPVPPC